MGRFGGLPAKKRIRRYEHRKERKRKCKRKKPAACVNCDGIWPWLWDHWSLFSALKMSFFLWYIFSELAFSHNQEKGSNPVVLCTPGGCNRAISGENVLYFTSRYVFYCLVCFSSKPLASCGHYSTLLERHLDNSLWPDAEWSSSNGSGITKVMFSFCVTELLHLEAAHFTLNLWNWHNNVLLLPQRMWNLLGKMFWVLFGVFFVCFPQELFCSCRIFALFNTKSYILMGQRKFGLSGCVFFTRGEMHGAGHMLYLFFTWEELILPQLLCCL